MTEGTLTVSVLANTAKIYGKEIALGVVPATLTQKADAGANVSLIDRPEVPDSLPPSFPKQLAGSPG